MSSFKKEVIIRQITPMIHFQIENLQNWYATIRSSELKPKIDKFIIKRLKDVDTPIYEKYKHVIKYINNGEEQKENSPYKISVLALGGGDKIKVENAPYLNSNKDERVKERAFSFNPNDISITIFSYNKDILNLINEVVRYVLVSENFGKRQSKGFGGFLPVDMDEVEFEKILIKCYEGVYKKQLKKNYAVDEVFNVISDNASILKSGKNRPYKKSALMEYLWNENITWEKRAIKEEMKSKESKLFEEIKGTHKIDDKNRKEIQKIVFARAMLGLPAYYEFIGKGRRVKVNITNKDGIERFKSPITFKVFGNNLYMVSNEVDDKIRNKEFEFKLDNPKSKFNLTLRTPTIEEFSLINFLDSELNKHGLGYKKLT